MSWISGCSRDWQELKALYGWVVGRISTAYINTFTVFWICKHGEIVVAGGCLI